MNKTWRIIAAIIVLAVVAGSGFYIWRQNKEVKNQSGVQGTNTQIFLDDVHGIRFEYPKSWVAIGADDSSTAFHKDSAELAELEKEGFIYYEFIENPEKKTLQAYFDQDYENCIKTAPVDPVFGQPCRKYEISTWTMFEVKGHKVYQSDWQGIPESGERAKFTYILDDSSFLSLSAWSTGQTDVESIEQTLGNILGTINLK